MPVAPLAQCPEVPDVVGPTGGVGDHMIDLRGGSAAQLAATSVAPQDRSAQLSPAPRHGPAARKGARVVEGAPAPPVDGDLWAEAVASKGEEQRSAPG